MAKRQQHRLWKEIQPIGGVHLNVPADAIPEGGSPDMNNCFIDGNTLAKRPGYEQWGSGAVHASERVTGIFSVQAEDDTTHLFVTSQTQLKKYAGSNWSAAFSGPALSGGNEKLFDWTVSQNAVCFCQGSNQVLRVPFSGTTYAILDTNCPPAYFLTRYADRLFLGYTVESGQPKPFRARRSVNGDDTDWTGIGSGFTDLSEFPYHIKGISKHGSSMIVATESAIWTGTRTSNAGAPVQFFPITTDVGVYAQYTLIGRGQDHLFLGDDNIYGLSGTTAVPIGERVRDTIFAILNVNKKHMDFSAVKVDSQEWLLFLCTGENEVPDTAWVWHWGKDAFYPWSVNGPLCATIHRMDASRAWDDLTTTWAATTWEWASTAMQTNYPALITGHSDGKAYRWSEEFMSDAGTAIDCRWTSRDFGSDDLGAGPGHKVTLRQVAITYRDTGSPCTLKFYFSSDGGSSWAGPYPVTFGGGTEGYKTTNLWHQTTGDRIRFKIENNTADETFRISAFNLEFEVRGAQLYA